MEKDLEKGGANFEEKVTAGGVYPQRAVRDDVNKAADRVINDGNKGEKTVVFTDWASI